MFFEILVEGKSDVPVVDEVLSRKFELEEDVHYRIHPHKGKGRLPVDPKARPDPRHRGLLDQLPAKLRGMSWMDENSCVVVLVDSDDDDCRDLKSSLINLYESLDQKPRNVLFRIAVEETESWLIADSQAVKAAFPYADVKKIAEIEPDSVCGAWERLAECLGRRPQDCHGGDKLIWAERISTYVDLDEIRSPSMNAFVAGIGRYLERLDA